MVISDPETPPGGDAHSETLFARPAWTQALRKPADSTPRVATSELQRPLPPPDDSILWISTGDLMRPTYRR